MKSFSMLLYALEQDHGVTLKRERKISEELVSRLTGTDILNLILIVIWSTLDWMLEYDDVNLEIGKNLSLLELSSGGESLDRTKETLYRQLMNRLSVERPSHRYFGWG